MVALEHLLVAFENMHGCLLLSLDVRPTPSFAGNTVADMSDAARYSDGLAVMRGRVRIAYAGIGITYVVVILSIMLGCHPFHKNWQIYPDPGSEYYIKYIPLSMTYVC